MSFKFGRFFSLISSFILGAFFCLIGIFGLILPWSTFLQGAATNLIMNHTLILSLFGLGLVLTGLSIVIYAVYNVGYRYVNIRIGDRSIVVDENLIEQYLQNYWKKIFPQHQIPFYISIRKNFIQIVADLPALPESDQEAFLEKIREDFSNLFSGVLGYRNEIDFIAHFGNSSKS